MARFEILYIKFFGRILQPRYGYAILCLELTITLNPILATHAPLEHGTLCIVRRNVLILSQDIIFYVIIQCIKLIIDSSCLQPWICVYFIAYPLS